MKRRDLDNLIAQNHTPQAIMLYGESHFLIDRYTRRLSDVEDANALTLFYDEYRLESAKTHLSQGSLFGGLNLLILRTDAKIPKNDQKALLELVQKNPDNRFIYAYYGTDTKASVASAFTPKAGGESVRFFPPFPNEARQIVLEEATAQGIDLDPYAADYLLGAQNGDLAPAVAELPKLALVEGRIGQKEIDALVFGTGAVKRDDLYRQILEKRPFVQTLQRLIDGGEEEVGILMGLHSHLAQLFLFFMSIRVNGSADSRQILGYALPQQVQRSREQESLRLQLSQYVALLDLLSEAERKIKSAGMRDANTFLTATLFQVQRLA